MDQKRVFLSYCHKDLEIASRLYADLCASGVPCWFDRESLLPGQRWKESISVAIQESSCFLALMSSNSVSNRGYVQKELRLALEVLDQLPQAGIFVIPIRIDDCTPSHEALSELHRVDLFPSYKSGLEKILLSISALHGQDYNLNLQVREGKCSPETWESTAAPRRMFDVFPIGEIYDEVARGVSHVRVLATWLYGMPRLMQAISEGIRNMPTATAQILILKSDSPFAEHRSEELGFERSHGKHHISLCLRTFNEVATNNPHIGRSVEVRLYDSSTEMIMFDLGSRVLYSTLFKGALAAEGPVIEVPRGDSVLYAKVVRHFDILWRTAVYYNKN